ncbi:hypothetical protein Tco_0407995 [Tanacetum coccineum]
MSKLLYTRFTKLIIDYFLSCNKNIPHRSNSKMHSEGDDSPITKLSNTVKGTYKFRMEIPDTMIDDAFKKSARYKYYKAKKVESDYEANIPKLFKKDVVPRKTRSLTVAEETIAVELAKSISINEQRSKASILESLKQKKQVVVGEGLSAAHTKYYDTSNTESDATRCSSCSDTSKESANETDDADDYDMDLYNDNPDGDDAAAGFGEMFLDDAAHHILSPLETITHKIPINLQPNSIQAKAKKLMQKAKKNMRKINFKKTVAHKFREYDQKLESLTNFHVSKAFEKAVQAKVMKEMKKLLPTHILTVVANYVRPRLNTSVLKIKLLNIIHLNKSNDTHTTHQQLYDTLYESITLDQEALDAQDAEPSFHKRIVKRRTTWLSDIDQNKNHILGPSTVAIAKKLKAIIQKDKLTITDLEGAGLEKLKQYDEDDVSKPRSFERHMSKNTKPHPTFYHNDFYYLVSLSTEEKHTTSLTKHYVATYYIQDSRINFFKAEMSNRLEGKIYSDLRIKSVVRIVVKKKWGYGFLTSIVVRRFDDNEYEFSYADLPRLSLNDVKDIKVVIQNKVEDIQLGVESYQQTLNLTKPMMFFEGIDQRIPFIMTATHKGVVYLNQHNFKSLMRLSEVKTLCDDTLEKIRENLIDMVTKNKLGKGNKRLKGRDWTDNDIVKSNEMVKKIDHTLKRREQLKRLEEYVGESPKTVNPHTFVRPI